MVSGNECGPADQPGLERALIISSAVGRCLMSGKPKMLESHAAETPPIPPNCTQRFPDIRQRPTAEDQSLVTLEISQGLLGRPVPSRLLPS